MFTDKMTYNEFQIEMKRDYLAIAKYFVEFCKKNNFRLTKMWKENKSSKKYQMLDMIEFHSTETGIDYFIFITHEAGQNFFSPFLFGVMEKNNGKKCLVNLSNFKVNSNVEIDSGAVIYDFHIFSRYRERVIKKDVTIKRSIYLLIKEIISDQENTLCGGFCKFNRKREDRSIITRLKSGAIVGEFGDKENIIINKTFISNEMLGEDQAKIMESYKEKFS